MDPYQISLARTKMSPWRFRLLLLLLQLALNAAIGVEALFEDDDRTPDHARMQSSGTTRDSDIVGVVSHPHFETMSVRETQLIFLRDLYDVNTAQQNSSRSFLDWFVKEDDGGIRTDYCDFTGVICDDKDHVIALDLNSTGLTGTIPSSLSQLSLLRRLKVWNNELVGEIPVALSHLTHLRQINLGRNHFVGSIPDLSLLYGLRHLMLHHNNIDGVVPSSLCELGHMTALGLSENSDLHGQLPDCLGSLPHLKVLRIKNLGLTGHIPSELCKERDFNGFYPNKLGCDAIACGAGYYEPSHGRQVDNQTACLPCGEPSNVLGSTMCQLVQNGTEFLGFPTISPTTYLATSQAPSISKLETAVPSAAPTLVVSTVPSSLIPSKVPSVAPSILPSGRPSNSDSPSTLPSSSNVDPSLSPSLTPSLFPSKLPSHSFIPSDLPITSNASSLEPSQLVSSPPSLERTSQPADSISATVAPSNGSVAPSLGHVNEGGSAPPSIPPSSADSLSPSQEVDANGFVGGGFKDDAQPNPNYRGALIALLIFVACCTFIILFAIWRRRRDSADDESNASATEQDPDIEPDIAALRSSNFDDIFAAALANPEIDSEVGNFDYEYSPSDMDSTLDTTSVSLSLQLSQFTDPCSDYNLGQGQEVNLSTSGESDSRTSSDPQSAHPSSTNVQPPRHNTEHLSMRLLRNNNPQAMRQRKQVKVHPVLHSTTASLETDCGSSKSIQRLHPWVEGQHTSRASVLSLTGSTLSFDARMPILPDQLRESSIDDTPDTSSQSPQGHVGFEDHRGLPCLRRKWIPVESHYAFE